LKGEIILRPFTRVKSFDKTIGRIMLWVSGFMAILLGVLMLIYKNDKEMFSFLAGGASACTFFMLWSFFVPFVMSYITRKGE
jgi:hypothetical protein